MPKGVYERRKPDYEARFWSKVDKTGECWLWQGKPMPEGYGRFWNGERVVLAHNFAYLLESEIPEGYTVDHVDCISKLCVRRSHLEVVTRGENVRRYFRKQTHCARGHSLADALIHHGRRECRECARIAKWRRKHGPDVPVPPRQRAPRSRKGLGIAA